MTAARRQVVSLISVPVFSVLCFRDLRPYDHIDRIPTLENNALLFAIIANPLQHVFPCLGVDKFDARLMIVGDRLSCFRVRTDLARRVIYWTLVFTLLLFERHALHSGLSLLRLRTS